MGDMKSGLVSGASSTHGPRADGESLSGETRELDDSGETREVA